MGQSFKRIKNSSMKAIHLLIATLIMMSLHPAQQKVVTPLTTQVQRIFGKNVWRQKCYIRGKQF